MDVLIYMHLSVRLSIDKMLTKLAKIIVKIGKGFLKMVDRRSDKTFKIITKIKNNNYNKNYWE